jgi:transposase
VRPIKAKTSRIVNEKTLIATVDIGQIKHMGYCRCPDGREVAPFEFFNTGHGFQKFWERVDQAMSANHLEQVVIGFESTGPYAEPLIHYLRKRPVRLVQVNPMHTKRLKELQGNSPNKTDRKDPKVIADIIELGHALTVVIPEGPAAELRRLTQARERRMEGRTALLNQLQHLLFVLFPEFLQLMKDVKTRSAKYLLSRCPTPQDLLKCDFESLVSSLRKLSRGRVGRERLGALYAAARESAGIQLGQEAMVFEIRNLLHMIEESERFIAEVEEKMSSVLKQIPYSRSILSIKGIGEVTAAGLIGEVGDFRKFKTISEITKLAGLDLFEVSSGKHQGRRRISKRGRSLLRKLLFFAALNMIRRAGSMRQIYQGYLQRGMLKMKAMIAIARKLLRIIFALVRDQSIYRENYTPGNNALTEAA